MPLGKALHILASVHTKDDEDCGFVIMHRASPNDYYSQYSPADYFRAWASVRAHIHMQHEPKSR